MSAMATFQCPKGHTSTDPVYCSECGALIGPPTVTSATAANTAPAHGPEICPDCQTPRTPGARFCEVCRYDFEQHASSGHVSPPVVAPAVTSAAADAAAVVGT